MADNSSLTETSLKPLLISVLTSKVAPYSDSFLASATKNEIKGLKIISSICKHEGRKKFRPRVSQNDSVLDTTLDNLKKKYLKSNYNSEFCKESGPETDIFKYKKLNELKCSEVLNGKCLEYVERWLGLKDDIYYQDHLLMFLRGIYSVYKSEESIPTSMHRESYSWVRAHRASASPNKLVPLSKLKTPVQSKRSESLSLSKPVHNPSSSRVSPQLQALKALRGNGELTSWISNVHSKHTSQYQETYVPIFHKPSQQTKSNFHTSVVCRLLPSSQPS